MPRLLVFHISLQNCGYTMELNVKKILSLFCDLCQLSHYEYVLMYIHIFADKDKKDAHKMYLHT